MSIKGFSINGSISRYDYNALDNKPAGGGAGLTEEAKQALLQCFQKVAYIDANGETYYQALYDALYATPKVLSSISASYTQSGEVLTTDSLDSLRKDLVVTAYYSDSTSATVSDYSLSGSLTAGTSTVTVYYNGQTDTISVNVTAVAGTYTISNRLTGCTTSNSATTITEGGSYTATITASSGYTLTGATASVTMGGNTVTGAYSNGTISITNVTGDIVITVTAVARTVSSISAVFTQSDNIVYTTDTLDSLKQYLVVTANYADGGSEAVSNYTLSGTLAEGISTITVTYSGQTDTFTVTVSAEPLVPAEYQQVEYVQRPSGSGVGVFANTGVKLSGVGNVVVNAEFMQTSAGAYSQNIVGIRINIGGTNTTALSVGVTSTEDGVFAYSGESAILEQATTTVNKRFNVTATFTGSNCSITDGESTATSTEYEPLDYSNQAIHIFGRRKANVSQVSDSFIGNCYYVKITEDGVTKVELIPCTRKSDDAVGFWNRANSTFITNASLVAGPVVGT